jgi:tetratricopeptide (TPR) repeat protein
MLKRTTLCGLTMLATIAMWPASGRADDLRNIRRGEPMPAYRLPTISGETVESDALKGRVIVMVCLSAEQRRSELAAMDASAVVAGFEPGEVFLVYVTADAIHKAYFEKFRSDRNITAPLAFDADRALFANLGLIVYPTTIVIGADAKLMQVMSLHDGEYRHTLHAYVRHALGQISDQELGDEMSQPSARNGTPKSTASAHRAMARSQRERGNLLAARDELLKAREQDPTDREIQLDMADLELALGDLEEAEEIIALVLESEPDHRRAKQLKGIALYRRDMLDEAQMMLEESIVLNPRPELAHYYLGLICEENGDQAGAVSHYRIALQHLLGVPSPPPQPPNEGE